MKLNQSPDGRPLIARSQLAHKTCKLLVAKYFYINRQGYKDASKPQ